LLGFLVVVGSRDDVVVAELRHRDAVWTVEHVDRAPGRDSRDRADGAITHDGQYDVKQVLRHRIDVALV
jgi:hypothetical protein